MAKKTGFDKVLGRHDYIVKEMRIYKKDKQGKSYTEVLTFLDFTSKR